MLVLTRGIGEQITVTGPCIIEIVRIAQNSVRIGITADPSVNIRRTELPDNPPPRFPRPGEIKT